MDIPSQPSLGIEVSGCYTWVTTVVNASWLTWLLYGSAAYWYCRVCGASKTSPAAGRQHTYNLPSQVRSGRLAPQQTDGSTSVARALARLYTQQPSGAVRRTAARRPPLIIEVNQVRRNLRANVVSVQRIIFIHIDWLRRPVAAWLAGYIYSHCRMVSNRRRPQWADRPLHALCRQ